MFARRSFLDSVFAFHITLAFCSLCRQGARLATLAVNSTAHSLITPREAASHLQVHNRTHLWRHIRRHKPRTRKNLSMQSSTESNAKCPPLDARTGSTRQGLSTQLPGSMPRILVVSAAILTLTLSAGVRLKRGKTLTRVAAQTSVSYSNLNTTI